MNFKVNCVYFRRDSNRHKCRLLGFTIFGFKILEYSCNPDKAENCRFKKMFEKPKF